MRRLGPPRSVRFLFDAMLSVRLFSETVRHLFRSVPFHSHHICSLCPPVYSPSGAATSDAVSLPSSTVAVQLAVEIYLTVTGFVSDYASFTISTLASHSLSDKFYDTVAPVVAAFSALCLLVVQSSVSPATIDIFSSLWGHPSVAAALNAIRNNATMWCGLEHGTLLFLLLIIGTVGALWLSVWRWTDGRFFPRWCIIRTRRGAQSCRRCALPPKRRYRPPHDTIQESPSTMAIDVGSETSTDPTPPMPWWVADVVVP